jgi:hypothetical protein
MEGTQCSYCAAPHASKSCACHATGTLYCNAQCQKSHWSEHKKFCSEYFDRRREGCYAGLDVHSLRAASKLLPVFIAKQSKENQDVDLQMYTLLELWIDYPGLCRKGSDFTNIVYKLIDSSKAKNDYASCVPFLKTMIDLLSIKNGVVRSYFPSPYGSKIHLSTYLSEFLHKSGKLAESLRQYTQTEKECKKIISKDQGEFHNTLCLIYTNIACIFIESNSKSSMIRNMIRKLLEHAPKSNNVSKWVDRTKSFQEHLKTYNPESSPCRACGLGNASMMCSCGDALYCDVVCQRRHWGKHVQSCQEHHDTWCVDMMQKMGFKITCETFDSITDGGEEKPIFRFRCGDVV